MTIIPYSLKVTEVLDCESSTSREGDSGRLVTMLLTTSYLPGIGFDDNLVPGDRAKPRLSITKAIIALFCPFPN